MKQFSLLTVLMGMMGSTAFYAGLDRAFGSAPAHWIETTFLLLFGFTMLAMVWVEIWVVVMSPVKLTLRLPKEQPEGPIGGPIISD